MAIQILNAKIKSRIEDPRSIVDSCREAIFGLDSSNPRYAYLQSQVFSKFCDEPLTPASLRKDSAIAKFLEREAVNAEFNDSILTIPGDYQILPRVRWNRFLAFTKELIESVLGPVPPESIFDGSFSGGASTSRRRTSSHPAWKYTGKAHCTTAVRSLVDDVLSDDLLWVQLGLPEIELHESSVLFTVPKSSTIDRCAAKEPDLNMYLQKGAGDVIRSCLRRKARINLNDQSHNRALARMGSETGDLATVDLSSASDSVTTSLVEVLLPELWFSYLNQIRVHSIIINDKVHELEMFSTMGNGFTFELESLIFWALTKAVCYFTGERGVISVYGDDIICPTGAFNDLQFVLGALGFSVNTKKSFASGPFRESCGGHYYNGSDITPFYIRSYPRDLTDLIHLANSVRFWSNDNLGIGILDPALEPLWLLLRSMIPDVVHGANLFTRYGLVTPDIPRKRLVSVKRSRSPNYGAYLLWHRATSARLIEAVSYDTDPVVTSLVESETSQYRLRRWHFANSNEVSDLFLSEV